uniref:Uncharacterized protein n=1 Tax=Oryza rufipogon TaxID=4529 RepID=A0A0E0QVD6_ORYRU
MAGEESTASAEAEGSGARGCARWREIASPWLPSPFLRCCAALPHADAGLLRRLNDLLDLLESELGLLDGVRGTHEHRARVPRRRPPDLLSRLAPTISSPPDGRLAQRERERERRRKGEEGEEVCADVVS